MRDEGTTYALHSFFRKLAQGVGPSLGLVLATWMGYNAALGPNQLIAYGLVFNLNKMPSELGHNT